MYKNPKNSIEYLLNKKHKYKLWIRLVSIMMIIVSLITIYALILPAITLEKKANCGIEEHIHTEACYKANEIQKKIYTCNVTEDADFVLHKHDEYCYDDTGNLICTLAEREAHSHTQECYSENGELICGKPQVLEHIHSEACYDENKILICGLSKIISHQHTSECFENIVITDETVEKVCNLEEHTHIDQCFMNPEDITFSYEDENVKGVITIPWSDKLPDDLSCEIVNLNGTEDNYNEMYKSITDAISSDNNILSDMKIYQVEWYSEGDMYTLPDELEKDIEMELKGNVESGETLNALVLDKQDKENETKDNQNIINESNLEMVDELNIENESIPSNQVDYNMDEYEHIDDLNVDKEEYTATIVELENNSISMKLRSANTFALVRTTSIVKGDYYKRVDSIEEIKNFYNSGYTEKYVIVYASGVMQAFGTDTWYGAPIEIQPVKGYENKNYFRLAYIYSNGSGKYGYINDIQFLNPTTYKARHWQIKPHPSNSNAFYIWENEDINDELWASYWDGNQMFLEHDDITNTWRIRGKSNYMAYDDNSNSIKNITNTQYLAQCNMLIFRYVGGELEIQDDIKESEGIENNMPDPWTNYEYDDYKNVSDSKVGNVEEKDTPITNATVKYNSDSSTANIESEFGSKTKNETGDELFKLQQQNNGRLFTDKSVVYGSDDYGATEINGYGNYEIGDFSVTMSALGQEWMIKESVNTTAPIDVVYALDISNSMNSQLGDTTRWIKAMEAINSSMKNILERNNLNRVGLITFSNTSKEILPLDRYEPNNYGNFLEISTKSYSYQLEIAGSINTITKNSNIQTATGLKYAADSSAAIREYGFVPTTSFGFEGAWDKTYTQLGVQEAYDTFLEMANISEKNLTFEINGEVYKRQPIIILVTDGDPTLCTYNYMDPKSGPSYGQGESYGIEGYYSILSAKYFKNLTSILYQRQAGFFTIGISCQDEYTQAILEPTQERIQACKDGDTLTEKQLYNLLENKPGESGGVFTYKVKSQDILEYKGKIAKIGYNCPVIRGTYNPYTNNYNYCDKAWFDTFKDSNMNDIFDEIINRIQLVSNYNFFLKEGTSLVMTDYIGDSMEVKGTPVLRFYGKNYEADANTEIGIDASGNKYTIYHWSQTANRLPSDSKESEGTAVSLNGISVKVTTAQDNTQIVEFIVPEEAIPTYYPDLYEKFYYEELPVRLIYRVGISEKEMENLKGMSGAIKDKIYYTSKFNNETKEAMTTAVFTPDESNPYYSSNLIKENIKKENISNTSLYSFKEYVNGELVIQSLGNNGNLIINREDMFNLTIEKKWSEGTTPTEKVSVTLYASGIQQKNDGTDSRSGVWEIETVELGDYNQWKYEWINISKEEIKGEYTYTYTDYFIAENKSKDYSATYKDSDGNNLIAKSIVVNSTSGEIIDVNAVKADGGLINIINSTYYVLPNTGGSGTYTYKFTGIAIISIVCIIYTVNKSRKIC